MPQKTLGPLRKAWYNWKALRLPWRKRFLVGLDLQGNTFWEFRDTLSSHKYRMRRIVHYPHATHYSEVRISPQWHQWLRHTRSDPPSLTEQTQDLVRQDNLKALAAQADARWAANPSFLNAPEQPGRQQNHLTETSILYKNPDVSNGTANGVHENGRAKVSQHDRTTTQSKSREDDRFEHRSSNPSLHRDVGAAPNDKEDPWKKARGGPSEEWQPAAWSGAVTPRRQ